MNFTPWTLLIDVGIVSALLLLGKLARARLSFIQRLFIPLSIFAKVRTPDGTGCTEITCPMTNFTDTPTTHFRNR